MIIITITAVRTHFSIFDRISSTGMYHSFLSVHTLIRFECVSNVQDENPFFVRILVVIKLKPTTPIMTRSETRTMDGLLGCRSKIINKYVNDCVNVKIIAAPIY